MNGPNALQTTLLLSNVLILIIAAMLVLNHFHYYSTQGEKKRFPFISEVGCAENRSTSNLEIAILTALATLIFACFSVRYVGGLCNLQKLIFASVIPVLSLIGMSYDTKLHTSIHQLFATASFFIIAYIASDTPLGVLGIVLGLLNYGISLQRVALTAKNKKIVDKESREYKKVRSAKYRELKLRTVCQFTSYLLFICAIVAGNFEASKKLSTVTLPAVLSEGTLIEARI
jgi:hypothetical protein